MNKILITGIAGFIGFHLVKKLSKDNSLDIIGLDNINSYYDENLKFGRLSELGLSRNEIEYNKINHSKKIDNLRFIKLNIEDTDAILQLFKIEQFDFVINLAAQAGVRYSLKNPYTYIDSNILGFLSILEACRNYPVKHLIFASSSSVYGLNDKIPFNENDKVDSPASLYAATKKSNELMAHAYSHIYRIPSTGVRFFTVYGPWGRPDMAYFLFTKRIINGETIDIYNNGKMMRDFTYIDDIVYGLKKILNKIPKKDNNKLAFRIFNIGNNTPVNLMNFISILEQKIGMKAHKRFLPMQSGDVVKTYADINALQEEIGFKPSTQLEIGLSNFVDWYRDYYQV